MDTFKNKAERDSDLERIRKITELEATYKAGAEHTKRLPVLLFSVCPICAAPYYHTFDPFGFDGRFWAHMVNKVESNCEHACLIRSAYICRRTPEPLYYNNRTSLGPEIPYVIPRILRKPEMQAVISQIDLDIGDTLYAITYFSTQEFGERDLTSHWDDGQYKSCEPPKDIWDFNIRPWVESGKLRWCENTENGMVLSNAPADACPFYGMKGHIGKQFVYPDQDLFQARPARRHIRPEGYEE